MSDDEMTLENAIAALAAVTRALEETTQDYWPVPPRGRDMAYERHMALIERAKKFVESYHHE